MRIVGYQPQDPNRSQPLRSALLTETCFKNRPSRGGNRLRTRLNAERVDHDFDNEHEAVAADGSFIQSLLRKVENHLEFLGHSSFRSIFSYRKPPAKANWSRQLSTARAHDQSHSSSSPSALGTAAVPAISRLSSSTLTVPVPACPALLPAEAFPAPDSVSVQILFFESSRAS